MLSGSAETRSAEGRALGSVRAPPLLRTGEASWSEGNLESRRPRAESESSTIPLSSRLDSVWPRRAALGGLDRLYIPLDPPTRFAAQQTVHDAIVRPHSCAQSRVTSTHSAANIAPTSGAPARALDTRNAASAPD